MRLLKSIIVQDIDIDIDIMDADMIAATVMAADTSVGIAGKAALYAAAFDATDAWNAFAGG